ncbi:hypothetical protein [Rhizobium jaguaris]|uniref:Uncharacterized protein n=1 Tax=Rhizobium jaguaris TaxID=1312183 RepID=A0A387FK58_9HYPH|nr:hypothetical protein [Rhizobium jaguaris]AYG57807.1 hypothetical protein CCGE525_02520 [Rhizobium jaguaris]
MDLEAIRKSLKIIPASAGEIRKREKREHGATPYTNAEMQRRQRERDAARKADNVAIPDLDKPKGGVRLTCH